MVEEFYVAETVVAFSVVKKDDSHRSVVLCEKLPEFPEGRAVALRIQDWAHQNGHIASVGVP